MVKNFSDGVLVVGLACCLVVEGSTPDAAAWTLTQILVALGLPHGGLWLGHVSARVWPPNTQSKTTNCTQ